MVLCLLWQRTTRTIFSLSIVSQEEQIELTQACREFWKLWRNINTREAMLRLHWVMFIRDVNRQCSWVHSVNPLPMPAWEFSAAQRRTDNIVWNECERKKERETEREGEFVCLFCFIRLTLAIPIELALSSGIPWLVLSPLSHIP